MSTATSEKAIHKISVVIPLYNKAPYIARAIDSVLNQTEQDFEIIVVNDASTDGGEETVKKYIDSRIRLFHRQEPGPGGHAARNMGIQKASAQLVAFLDADDAYFPCFIDTILRLRRNYPEAGAYSTAYEIVECSGKVIKPKFRAIPPAPWEGIIPNYFESVLEDPPIWTSATAVPKEIFDAVGFFPEGAKTGGDLDMWLRIALKYKMAYHTYTGAIYHRDAVNRICVDPLPLNENALVRTIHNLIKNRLVDDQTLCLLKEYISLKELGRIRFLLRSSQIEEARVALSNNSTKIFLLERNNLFFLSKLPGPLLKLIYSIKDYYTNG
jgi:glycosyltransferase involved in cell wall biosynthesis